MELVSGFALIESNPAKWSITLPFRRLCRKGSNSFEGTLHLALDFLNALTYLEISIQPVAKRQSLRPLRWDGHLARHSSTGKRDLTGHCEGNEAISFAEIVHNRDCFVASLLAMTTCRVKLSAYLSKLFLWPCLCYLYYDNNVPGDSDLARKLSLSIMISLLGLATCVIAAEEHSEFQRGLALRMEGKNAQAVEAFGKVPADSPEYVRALVQKGAALEDMGKKREASNAYERGSENRPAEFFRSTQSWAVELGRNDGRRCSSSESGQRGPREKRAAFP